MSNHEVDVKVIPANLTDPSMYDSVFDEALKDKKVKLVINNAGYAHTTPFFKEDPGHIQRMMKVNMYPITCFTKHALARFKLQEKQEPDQNYGLI